MMLKKLTTQDLEALVQISQLLWPHHQKATLFDEFSLLLKEENAAIFGKVVDGELRGFAQCQLRYDYVEGTVTSPVAYLEGIFVKETYRQQGIARELCQACEKWGEAMGCREFASDCEITNTASFNMHLKLGFIEKNRLVCFAKSIINS